MNQANVNIDKTILKVNTAISDLKSGIKTAKLTKENKADIMKDLG